jgi:DNA-binding transcriptional ArsR family regulator
MSLEIVENRLKRLVESGLRGSCRPAERILQLRRRLQTVDESRLRRMEDLFSGLGDRTRLRILRLIAKEELCSCEVMATLELTQPTASHHLGILERAGLVSGRREGKWVFYKIADPRVEILLSKGLEVAEKSY